MQVLNFDNLVPDSQEGSFPLDVSSNNYKRKETKPSGSMGSNGASPLIFVL